jgi:hypothetical protein
MPLTIQELEEALGIISPEEPLHEKRREKRFGFPCKQLVAFCSEDATPADDEFVFVECRDISAIGIAFYTPTLPPDRNNCVVCALGSSSSLTYMRSRIVRVSRTRRHDEMVYLVGCQFIGPI